MSRSAAARAIFAVTAAISLVTLGIELVWTAFGLYADSEPGGATGIIRWFSYFTNGSNILCVVGLTLLARNPARDGRWFRPLRLTGLVGITVTFIVYMVALRPSQVLEGIHIWTNAGYHVAVPILVVSSWLVFGPFPRFDARTLRVMLIAVAAWVAWTLIHGAVSSWYPYAIIDVTTLGYPTAMRTAAVIIVLIGGIALLYIWLDRVRARSRQRMIDR
jgi:hypothetical protein